jgi:hypothetical protein
VCLRSNFPYWIDCSHTVALSAGRCSRRSCGRCRDPTSRWRSISVVNRGSAEGVDTDRTTSRTSSTAKRSRSDAFEGARRVASSPSPTPTLPEGPMLLPSIRMGGNLGIVDRRPPALPRSRYSSQRVASSHLVVRRRSAWSARFSMRHPPGQLPAFHAHYPHELMGCERSAYSGRT